MKRQDLQIQVPCPLCKLGKYPSGARCSTCEGEGWVLTLLGVEIAALIDDRIQRKYGKSLMDTTPTISASDKTQTAQANPTHKQENVSPAKNLPGAAPKLPDKSTNLLSMPTPREHRRSPQTGAWTLP